MSNLMSAPRKALLEHLAELPDNRSLELHFVAETAGISPRSSTAFRRALVEDELAQETDWFWPNGGIGRGIKITAKGREALKNAVLPEQHESRKADDRSVEVAKLLANPMMVRANVTDLHHILVAEQPEAVAKRNLALIEELLALLNGVARKAAA